LWKKTLEPKPPKQVWGKQGAARKEEKALDSFRVRMGIQRHCRERAMGR
jgi:hypothetical protein